MSQFFERCGCNLIMLLQSGFKDKFTIEFRSLYTALLALAKLVLVFVVFAMISEARSLVL